MEKKIKRFTEGRDRREIFLAGYYLSFIFLMSFAAVTDIMVDNTIDAKIEVVLLVPALLSLWYYWRSGNVNLSVYILVALTTLTTYALLISNEFNLPIFHVIVPLGYFLLFSLRVSLIITFIHQAIVVLLYLWATEKYPDSIVVGSPAMQMGIVVASLTVILFGVLYHIAVENSYKTLENVNRQKTMLLNEVHHRVKNNLNVISSMLGLQMIGESRAEVKEMIGSNRQRIDSIAMVHEMLYKHEDFEYIDIVEYLRGISRTIFSMGNKDVEVHVESSYPTLPFEMALKLGIITNELITNSMKYAFADGKGSIDISISDNGSNYTFCYKDSSEEPLDIEALRSGRGLGMRLIEMMVEQMDSKMKIDGTKGMKYTMWKPKNG